MIKYLIIQLRQLGDILLTTPIPKAIKSHAPQAHVTFLAHSMGNLILKDNPYIDEIVTYNESESVAEQIKKLLHLQKQKYHIVFDFMNNPRSAVMSVASGAKKRYGFSSIRSLL